jgi:FMN phosphatase YigB (HAD superfamily)
MKNITAFVSDFSRVLLSPKDENYSDGLNTLHKKLSIQGDYDFWSYFQLNEKLLNFYRELSRKMKIYLFTTEHIQNHSSLQPYLDGVFTKIFSGADLGLEKTNIQSYEIIANMIGTSPNTILYIDDNQRNLDAANAAGMSVIKYISTEQAISSIEGVLAIE